MSALRSQTQRTALRLAHKTSTLSSTSLLPPSICHSLRHINSHRPPQSHHSFTQSRHSSSSGRWKTRQSADHFTREAKIMNLRSRAAFKLLELDAKYRLFRRTSKGQVVVDLGFAPGSWSQVAVDRVGPKGTVVGIDILPAQPPRGVSTFQGNFLNPGVQKMLKEFLLEEKENKRLKGGNAVMDEVEEGEEGDEDKDVVVERKSYIDLEREVVAEREHMHAAAAAAAEEKEMEGNGEEGEPEDAEKKRRKNLRMVDVVLSDMSEPWPQTHGFTINSLSNPYIRMMNTSGIAIKDHAGSMDLCRAALSFASETLKSGGHFVCKFYQGSEDKDFEKILKKMFTKVHREKPESSRSESKESFFVALKRKGDVTLEDAEPGTQL
ncbi:FtsJ-like methyltransferase-domain-containing protein [Cladorrhinum sp. PSN332]|nr:FtsJ-like methyltransferase-domain-containing protein [Cladorrhinum sp. PSN332]